MNQKYLSIIIPVYNVAPYLRECLDSVFSQSAPSDRYEVICVDDGSSDESGEILSAYKEQHGNFTVIRQNNAGVSAARNRGMDAAQGEYLWFVDGDDFIGTDCISGILDDLRRESPDLLLLKPIAFDDGTDTSVFHQRNVQPDATTEEYRLWLWTCVYRRTLVTEHNVRFYEGLSYAEDNLFCSMLVPFVQKKSQSGQVAYFYRRRANSLSTTATEKKLDQLIQAAQIFLQCGENGSIGRDSAMYEVCYFMCIVMSALAVRPRLQVRPILRALRAKRLFPLKKQKHFSPQYRTDGLSTENRILRKLKYVSYTRFGYYALRAFRFFLRIKRRIIKNDPAHTQK